MLFKSHRAGECDGVTVGGGSTSGLEVPARVFQPLICKPFISVSQTQASAFKSGLILKAGYEN